MLCVEQFLHKFCKEQAETLHWRNAYLDDRCFGSIWDSDWFWLLSLTQLMNASCQCIAWINRVVLEKVKKKVCDECLGAIQIVYIVVSAK